MSNAREKVQRMQEQERKEEKYRKIGLFSLIGIIVAALALTGAFLVMNKPEKITPQNTKQLTPQNFISDGTFRINSSGAVDTSKSEEATPGAVRTLMVFDPQCPACGKVDREIGGELKQMVSEKKIDLYVSPVSFLDKASTDQYSMRAANAVVTVAEKSPQHAIEFIHEIYKEKNQPREATEYVSVSDEKLGKWAKNVGVSEEVANSFAGHAYVDWITKHTENFNTNRKELFPEGISTPAVFVGGTIKNGKIEGAKLVDFSQGNTMKEAFINQLNEVKKANK